MLYPSITWIVVVLSAGSALGAEKIFDFREDKPNITPRGFRSAVSGVGQAGDWKVIQDDVPSLMETVSPGAKALGRRPVLAQLSRDEADEHFPLLIYEDET